MERDDCPIMDRPPKQTLKIGMMAYNCLPNLVFVQVPNERARWILTDTCVALVDCENCGAVSGEPCHNGKQGLERRYHVGTHWVRRAAKDRRHVRNQEKPKLVVSLPALEEARAILDPEDEHGTG